MGPDGSRQDNPDCAGNGQWFHGLQSCHSGTSDFLDFQCLHHWTCYARTGTKIGLDTVGLLKYLE